MSPNKFEDVYMSLSRKNKHHVKVRNRIVNELKISTPIFYNWLKGITPVPYLARPIISKILEIPQSELFPENESETISN